MLEKKKTTLNVYHHLLVVCLFYNMKKTHVNLEVILNKILNIKIHLKLINITNMLIYQVIILIIKIYYILTIQLK